MNDGFYRAFEERYYASRDVIKGMRAQYLPFVMPLKDIYDTGSVYDIGCGRGEWLSIINDEFGWEVFGVDLDEGMLKDCLERGLSVKKGDAIEYLKTIQTESQLIVSAFHVVEHINFEQLKSVVIEGLRVLKPGGLLIMETPNPENIIVATNNFYVDPTHQRPIPHQLLSFVPEFYGFKRVKTVRLQESKSILEKSKINLKDVLSGVSPDYAVVAQKNAPTKILQKFDEVFDKEYGLSLNELLVRYDGVKSLEKYKSRLRKKPLWQYLKKVRDLIKR